MAARTPNPHSSHAAARANGVFVRVNGLFVRTNASFVRMITPDVRTGNYNVCTLSADGGGLGPGLRVLS